MTTTVDVSEFINRHKVSGFQVRILILCVAAMILDGYDLQATSFVVPTIAAKWAVARASFGPVFSAALLGTGLGALLFGSLADRFGRKNIMLFCLAWFGVFTLAKASASSVPNLLVFQFIAGLGVGGVVPNVFALLTEYSPQHRRALVLMISGCGFSLGAGGSGVVASQVLANYGWQPVFYLGGILPLVLIPIIVIGLPESIRFLMLYQSQNPSLERILKKLDPDLQTGSQLHLVSSEEKVAGVPAIHLLTDGRAPSTLLLWIVSFMDLIIIYFLLSWLPVMLHDSGLSVEDADLATAFYSIAGILGGPVVGWLIDRFGIFRMLPLAFALAAVFIFLIGVTSGSFSVSFGVIGIMTAGAGFWELGGHFGTSILASQLYPTFMRSTGVGWALGIGRFCAMSSPMLGGLLIGWQWSHATIFSTVAIPACIAAIAILLIKAVHKPQTADGGREMPAAVVETT